MRLSFREASRFGDPSRRSVADHPRSTNPFERYSKPISIPWVTGSIPISVRALKSALSAAAAQNPIDFVIASGDYLRHDFRCAFIKAGGSPRDFPTFATKAAVFVVNTVQATLGVPVYLALGNDDSFCVDYGLGSELLN
jgi:hypothetical protein